MPSWRTRRLGGQAPSPRHHPSSTLATYSRREPRFSTLTRYFPPGATLSFTDYLEVRVGQLRVDDARAALHRRMPTGRTEDEIDQARAPRDSTALVPAASRYERFSFPGVSRPAPSSHGTP